MQESPFKILTDQIQQVFNPKLPITNLVFKGGGVRGVAYLGALQVLDEHDLLNDLKRVGGTSAGSLTALLLSMNLSVSEIEQILSDIDFPKMLQDVNQKDEQGLVKNFMSDAASVQRFRAHFGWHSNDNMHNLIEQIVARGCQGNSRATFDDFRKLGHRSLSIIASNVSRYRREIFSIRTTPHVAVADAALLSSSIPIFFEAVRFDGKNIGQGDYYVDGGLYDNYPIHIFDYPEYVNHKRNFRDGTNHETIGFFLYPNRENKDVAHLPNRWNEFIELIFSNFYFSHQVKAIITDKVNKNRTIRINDCGVKATDFKITAGSDKYEQLLQSGRDATRQFLLEKGYIKPES